MPFNYNPFTGKLDYYATISGGGGAAGPHTITSHSDVDDANGAQLEELTGGGDTLLHTHAGGGGDLLAINNLSDVVDASTSFENIKQAATDLATGVVELATDGESAPSLAVQANDSRLADSRTPLAHDHPSSEVTDFDTEVGNHSDVTANTSARHNEAHTILSHDTTDGSDTTLHDHAGISENTTHRTGTGSDHAYVNANTAARHTRLHAITSQDDHTAGSHRILYTDGSGDVQELSLGATDQVLTSTGLTLAPIFKDPAGGAPHTITSHSDVVDATGAQLEELTGGGDTTLHDHAGISENITHRTGNGADHADVALNSAARHTEAHTVASHSDTTATGAELETLTDGSNADLLHSHVLWGNGIAEDIPLITVDEGTADPDKPQFHWDEATDTFEFNKSLTIPGGSLNIGSITLSEIGGCLRTADFHAHGDGGVAGYYKLHQGTTPFAEAEASHNILWCDSSGYLYIQSPAPAGVDSKVAVQDADNSLSVARSVIPNTGSDRAAINFGGGGSLLGAIADTDALLLSNAYYNDGYKYLTPDFAAGIRLNNGEVEFLTAPSGNINDPISWTSTSLSSLGGDFANGGESTGAARQLGNNDNYNLSFKTNNLARLTVQGSGDIYVNNDINLQGNLNVDDITEITIDHGVDIETVHFENGAITGLTTDLAIAEGGTGQSSAQAAIDALSQVVDASNEQVLTKDTVSGNAEWKDPSGGLTSSARAIKTGAHQSVSTDTRILFATEDYDINNEFASSRFTVTVAGRYMVKATIPWLADVTPVNNDYRQLKIYVNGSIKTSVIMRVPWGATTGSFNQSISDILNLSIDDCVEIYARASDSTYVGANSNYYASFFAITQIQ